MPRPEFPTPYTILTPGMISRIRSNQGYYDRNPERAEREQQERKERERLEQEQLEYEYRRQQEREEE
ncbi:MAG: hypothetical protein GF334_05055 [Candidatus Altiarchaeales archaeon]|nr:hypothetical protein [Candidatus Altiarchaeales archaeon]